MNSQRTCSIVWVRHGHTEYTEVFPDITNKGRQSLIKTAELIRLFAVGYGIKTFSSPKPRAQGSANCLVSALNLNPSSIVLESSITAVEQRQPEKVMQLVRRYRSSPDPLAVEKGYWTEPKFDDPVIVEPKAEIKKRLYSFLDRLIRVGLVCKKTPPDCYLCISHAEVIGHIVNDFRVLHGYNSIPAVGYAEPVFLNFSIAGVDQPVFVRYKFLELEFVNIQYSRLKHGL